MRSTESLIDQRTIGIPARVASLNHIAEELRHEIYNQVYWSLRDWSDDLFNPIYRQARADWERL